MKTLIVSAGVVLCNPNSVEVGDICILDAGEPTSTAVRVTYVSNNQMFGMIESIDDSNCKIGVLLSRLKPL